MVERDYDLFDPVRLAWVLTGLMGAVARLALAPEDQLEYLRRSDAGGLADELALEFDDFAGMLGQLEDAGWIEPGRAVLVRRIEGLVTRMSGAANAALWEPEALSIAPEWVEVRALAKEFVFGPVAKS